MNLIHFPEQNGVLAKSQPPYIPMPVHFTNDEQGRMICCWRLTLLERIKLLFTGRVWHQILTFHQPLQPQLLTSFKPRNMEWNQKSAVQPIPVVNPMPTPSPSTPDPDASTTWDVAAPSPTTSDPVPPQNSVGSGG